MDFCELSFTPWGENVIVEIYRNNIELNWTELGPISRIAMLYISILSNVYCITSVNLFPS